MFQLTSSCWSHDSCPSTWCNSSTVWALFFQTNNFKLIIRFDLMQVFILERFHNILLRIELLQIFSSAWSNKVIAIDYNNFLRLFLMFLQARKLVFWIKIVLACLICFISIKLNNWMSIHQEWWFNHFCQGFYICFCFALLYNPTGRKSSDHYQQ